MIHFGNWTRSVAIWLVWNIPCGRFAPALMGFALRSKPRLVESNNSKEHLKK